MVERSVAPTLEEAVSAVLEPQLQFPRVRQYLLRVRAEYTGTKHKETGYDPGYEIRVIDLDDPNDAIAKFVRQEEEKLAGYVADPTKIEIPKRNHRRRLRKDGEITEIRRSRLQEYRFELAVLSGAILAPITLFESTEKSTDRRYVGYSISREQLL